MLLATLVDGSAISAEVQDILHACMSLLQSVDMIYAPKTRSSASAMQEIKRLWQDTI